MINQLDTTWCFLKKEFFVVDFVAAAAPSVRSDIVCLELVLSNDWKRYSRWITLLLPSSQERLFYCRGGWRSCREEEEEARNSNLRCMGLWSCFFQWSLGYGAYICSLRCIKRKNRSRIVWSYCMMRLIRFAVQYRRLINEMKTISNSFRRQITCKAFKDIGQIEILKKEEEKINIEKVWKFVAVIQ